jgi:dephospho-CoA kinase
MFIIGLTGSIGMGKTTAAGFFAAAGVPVHDADAVVHRLYEGKAVSLIEAAFPGVTAAGKGDRAKLGARITGDPTALKRLEAIVHPLVRQEEEKFLADAARRGAPVVVLDIPLLIETGGHERVDAVVTVSAPASVQRERVLSRPGMTDEKFDALIARQMPDAVKRAHADFIIDTSQDLDVARAQVMAVLEAVKTMPPRRRP